MIRQRFLFSTAVAIFAAAGSVSAQTVQLTGRILEKASMLPVSAATVRLKGYNLTTTTDTAGRFTLSGNPVSTLSRQLAWSGPLLERGMLRLQTLTHGVVVDASLFDSRGKRLDRTTHRLTSAGSYSLAVLKNAPYNSMSFLKVTAGEETYRFRVFQGAGVASVSHTASIPGEGALARTAASAAAGDSVEVSITGLITKLSAAASNGDLGDIVMDTPPRDSVGLNAKRPYGAVVLFDGTKGPGAGLAEMNQKWVDWRDWPNGCQANSSGSTKNTSPAQFKIAKDPQFPNDTNRVTMRTHHATGAISRWGCDDIEARPELYTHGDVQIHVEWIGMGVYDSTDSENANDTTVYSGSATTRRHWINSGVYVQNRYEIQIQSAPLTGAITDCHYMGSVVNEFAPSATFGAGSGNTCNGTGMFASPCPNCTATNPIKRNGEWQSYDITFRTTRWNGTTKTADGYLTMWWNGQLVHYNRRVTGLATGVANTSGEAIDNKLYGIKLQREAGDVRYRNVWMKHLKIDSTNTAFGY